MALCQWRIEDTMRAQPTAAFLVLWPSNSRRGYVELLVCQDCLHAALTPTALHERIAPDSVIPHEVE